MRKISCLLGFCVLAALPATTRGADQYRIDPVHSAAIFRVKHMNVGYTYGRFNDIGGSVTIDEQDPAHCVFDIQVKAESLDTANAKRDGHLRSTDFFNVKEFPTIAFKSKQVKLAKPGTYEVTGDLTLHGVTKTITVTLQRVGTGNSPMGGQRTGFETNFSIRRSDYGMTGMQGPVGDDIWMLVSFEAVKQ
jgi:polyisoprenoid-binding protein YceI